MTIGALGESPGLLSGLQDNFRLGILQRAPSLFLTTVEHPSGATRPCRQLAPSGSGPFFQPTQSACEYAHFILRRPELHIRSRKGPGASGVRPDLHHDGLKCSRHNEDNGQPRFSHGYILHLLHERGDFPLKTDYRPDGFSADRAGTSRIRTIRKSQSSLRESKFEGSHDRAAVHCLPRWGISAVGP
jgi:hypothetical protein